MNVNFSHKTPPFQTSERFLELSRGIAQGWHCQHCSLSPQDLEGSKDVVQGMLRGQFEVMQRLNPNR